MSRVESEYYSYLGYGGERASTALTHYLQFFDRGPVLELGCGRGEFLTLLTKAGLQATGVDVDPGMVEQCRAAGHEVVLADALTHLKSLPAGTLGGVFAAHVLEHFPADTAAELINEVARALVPGGTFVAAVPNAGSLSVLGYDFWRDPTHVRFYDPQLIAFLVTRAGLSVSEVGANPLNDPGPPPETAPLDFVGYPSLNGEIVAAVQAAIAAATPPPADPPTGGRRFARLGLGLGLGGRGAATEPANDPAVRPGEAWSQFGHLVAVLDQRLQDTQHQLHALHTSYRNLLSRLYPPSEVYVAAVRTPPTKEIETAS